MSETKRYSCHVRRLVWEETDVEIQARDADEAHERAHDLVMRGECVGWVGDGSDVERAEVAVDGADD